ncbi:response regulator transcription factor [Rhodococcus sp. NPDC003382]|uniref:response regulator transcription factor n=1 Tax=Rhodococcus sp. HM1 TaxID=2937759 RepID=UPI00200A31FC|nr:helix-turn-helix transcriptional regulator [Rhodococcus sp. HM1]MCK8669581.1 helix-turn-helix transcriptional regulator [Rhodococcus sp. HM1]
MDAARSAARLKSTVRRAVRTATDSADFRTQILDALREQVPFDGGVVALLDPAVRVPTAATNIGFDDYAGKLCAELEYGPDPDTFSFDELFRRPGAICSVRQVTGGRFRTSRPYREFLEPIGVDDDVRMLFRGRDGTCWGVAELSRSEMHAFTDAEIGTLTAVLRDIGDGLRTSLLRQAAYTNSESDDGPAVVIVDDHDEPAMTTPAARAYFDRLGWTASARPAGELLVRFIAMRVRSSGGGPVVVRARTLDGEWVVLRAVGTADRTGPPGVVVNIERAHLPEVVTFIAAAHGLSARETDVVRQVLAGRTREEIGRALFISPYTVQDHLKSIFAKTGVHSRRDLVARLAWSHYVPRLGDPVASDGSFAAAAGG